MAKIDKSYKIENKPLCIKGFKTSPLKNIYVIKLYLCFSLTSVKNQIKTPPIKINYTVIII